MKTLNLFLLVTLVIASLTNEAQAKKATLCNGAKMRMLVVVVEDDRYSHWDSDYTSLGWYPLEPGACLPWDTSGADSDELYFYARSEGDNFWEWAGIRGGTDQNCLPSKTEKFEYHFHIDAYDNKYTCDGVSGYSRVLTTGVEAGETIYFNEGNATRRGSAISGPSTPPPPPAPTVQQQIEQTKKDVSDTEEEIKKLKKKEEKCNFDGIKELIAKDITDMDPGFLHSMEGCHDEFGNLAKEVEEVVAALKARLVTAVEDIRKVLKATDEALTAAGLVVADLYASLNLAPVMAPSAQGLDDGNETFFMWLTTGKYEAEYLTGIIARSEYDNFLGVVRGWGTTYEGFGTGEALLNDTSGRQLNYLKSVKYLLTYFERNKVEAPANPVPPEVYAAIDADIKPRDAEAASQLRKALLRWHGDKATVAQQLLLDTTMLVAGGYHNLTAATATAAVTTRLKGLVVDLTAAATDLGNNNSFLARGDLLYGCEMGGGLTNCSEGGLALGVFEKLASSVELTHAEMEIQQAFGQYLMAIAPAQQAQVLADKAENMNLMKKLVIVEAH